MPTKKSVRARKPAARARTRARSRAKSMTLASKARHASGQVIAVTAGLAILAVLTVVGLASSPAPEASRPATRSTAARPAPIRTEPRAAAPANRPEPVSEQPATPGSTQSAAAPVTIAGCLERDDDTFRLRDTSGAAAPKSRSWKSGFMRKSPSAVAVHDPAKRLNLSQHVGSRVSVTGTLDGSTIEGRSLRRVAGTCGEGRQVKI
jgi:hypothetical protein